MSKTFFLILCCIANGVTLASTKVLEIPLLPLPAWHNLTYQNIKPNKIEFKDNQLFIEVDNSASPLFYTFKQPRKFKRIRVVGKVNLSQLKQARNQRAEDFPFQIGIVYAGEKTLPWYKKIIAPEWVKQLFALAPEGTGLGYVHFLGVSRSASELESADVPLQDGLIRARVVSSIQADGSFQLDFANNAERPVLALWLHSDGDDEHLSYLVKIQSIRVSH